jgi:hypothetical protein
MEVAVMSLTVREQQALEGLGSRIARSDPVLAGQLAIFTRLTSGEAMPVRESTQLVRESTRPARGSRRLCQRLGVGAVAPLLFLVVAVALIAVAVAVTGGAKSNGACPTSWSVVCAAPTASTSR